MAKNPEIIICAVDSWTLIAQSTLSLMVWRAEKGAYYYFTYRVAGDSAPTGFSEAVPIFRDVEMDYEIFEYANPVDIYIYTKNDDGKVRIDDTQYVPTEIIDLRLSQLIDTMVLQANYNIDDTQIVFTCDTLPVIGDVVCLKEEKAFYQGEILTVAGTNPYTVDLDTPLDYPFTVAGGCSIRNDNMAVDGSVTPQEFILSPEQLTIGTRWRITRVMFTISDNVVMDDEKFGGITKLTKGIVLRVKNGITKNIFNIKTNGEFALHSYDAIYSDKAPAGFYGFRVRRTFGGEHKNDTVIELTSKLTDSDLLEIIIQDDLTDLESFRAVMQGKVL